MEFLKNSEIINNCITSSRTIVINDYVGFNLFIHRKDRFNEH